MYLEIPYYSIIFHPGGGGLYGFSREHYMFEEGFMFFHQALLLDYHLRGPYFGLYFGKAPILGFYHTLKVPLGFLQPFIIVLQSTFDCILCPYYALYAWTLIDTHFFSFQGLSIFSHNIQLLL